MCGICGIVNFKKKGVDKNDIQSMMDIMKHRGPDDEGLFIEKNVGLGFVRLSIIDLSPAGHQPMVSQDQRYVIVFNGEIYNYIELRQELKENFDFKTNTDTEVLLNAYRAWGPDCLDRFNGMFAFVIYDKKTGEIFTARDRYGIKPFYYYRDEERLIFASEPRSILPFLKNQAPNPQAIYEFLVYNRSDQGDYTYYKDIRKLPHGCCARITDKGMDISPWYVLEENLKEPFDSPEEFYETFHQAVKLRLRSDVPVGVCLSGGLDSSSIVSVLLKEFNKRDVNTFSAIYDVGDKADESAFIHEYDGQLDRMHFTRPSAESLLSDLQTFIKCNSEPMSALGPYAQFKVMQLAKSHVTVTLDGQGADEQLGGYHYFFASYFKELFRGFKWLRLLNELGHYGKIHRSIMAVKYLGLYMSPPFLKDRLSRISHDYIDKGFYKEGATVSTLKNSLYNPRTLNESLLQHFQFKLEHLLKWEDQNSMWHSLESRVPFLDHRLVERTLSLPPGDIIKKGNTKHILRESMRGVLPEKIRTRQDKVGFSTPWEKWFRKEAPKAFINEILHSESFKKRGYLDASRCIKGFNDFIAGKNDIAKEIWKWVNLELWSREFIDK